MKNLNHDHEHVLVIQLLNKLFQCDKRAKFFLLASPAWGKTSLIRKIYTEKKYKRILYLSPLIALNLEFHKTLQLAEIPSWVLSSAVTLEEIQNQSSFGVLISTPEKIFYSQQYSLLEDWSDLIVIDEFHLFLMWDNFRPQLRECWMWLSMTSKNVLLLSGTFDWEVWSQSSEGKLWLENVGMYGKVDLHQKRLLCQPVKEWFIPTYMKALFFICLKFFLIYCCRWKVLVFFPTREQVHRWERWCRKYTISHLSCLGGMAIQFVEQLQCRPDPQVILSTSVLSHGVNLPQRDIVIIMGNSWNKEIWWQMKSRGGRNGEKYYFFSEKQAWMN